MRYGVVEGKTAQLHAWELRIYGSGALSSCVKNGIAEFGDSHCDHLPFYLCHNPVALLSNFSRMVAFSLVYIFITRSSIQKQRSPLRHHSSLVDINVITRNY